jgi:hypothetical protein
VILQNIQQVSFLSTGNPQSDRTVLLKNYFYFCSKEPINKKIFKEPNIDIYENLKKKSQPVTHFGKKVRMCNFSKNQQCSLRVERLKRVNKLIKIQKIIFF